MYNDFIRSNFKVILNDKEKNAVQPTWYLIIYNNLEELSFFYLQKIIMRLFKLTLYWLS